MFGHLVRVVKRYPRAVGLVTYPLLGCSLFIAKTWNSDPIPTFIADHPEISFYPVSGWYGPGTWLALILSIISGTVALLRGAYTGSPPWTWSPDIVAVVVYCLVSCWNLRKMQQVVQGAEGKLGASMLPALVAANRAVVFSGGVLEVYAILLIYHLNPLTKNLSLRRTAFAQFVVAWAASFVPMFVLPPDMNPTNLSLSKYFPCLETDSACQSGRELTQTYVFLSQIVATFPGTTLIEYWHFYSEFDPPFFFLSFGMYGLGMTVITVLFHAPDWFRGVAWGLPIGIITTALVPVIMWILPVLMGYLIFYPLVCVIEFGTVLVLAAIPRSGVFPYSGISIGEVDQIGSLLIVVVYHSIHIMNSGVAKGWNIIRGRRTEENEILLSEPRYQVVA
ncbi:hypothetical protein DL96DRAFT_1819134 [Flagelloscypha sp. PMI_526]|nr:hypothetical protein DL96DRAFT_1819134 [Flagelloscypha sp. PMI_526]